MLTNGFKLYAGLGFAALAAALTYGIVSGDTTGPDYFQVIDRSTFVGVISLGWQGGVGEHLGYLIFFFVFLASLFLALVMSAFSDANPAAVAQISDEGEIPPAQATPRPSYWPITLALGIGIAAVGLAAHPAIMVIGLVVAAVALLEWALTAWGESVSSDPRVGRAVRNRLLWPVEVPVVGSAGIAIVVIAIWRVLIAVSEFSALWVATGLAAAVFAAAIMFAYKPKVGKSVVVGVVALAAVAVIVAGIIATAAGTRDFHHLGEDESHNETAELTQTAAGQSG